MPWDYLLQRTARSLNDEYVPNIMGSHSLPYVWATVFAFRKTTRAKIFFDLVQRIEANYHYYRELFNVESRSYRNDYAFAMANIILNGYSLEQHKSVPWSMLTVEQPIENIDIKNDFLVIRHQDRAEVVARQNVHVMDKDYLTSDKFKEFVNNVL